MGESSFETDWDIGDYIADHLGVARMLARREGQPFLVYLIEMAILEQTAPAAVLPMPAEPMVAQRI